MPLLDEPHCPQCLSTLPLSPLWRAAPKDRWGLLRGNVGILCPHCGARLRVIQTRANLAGWVAVAVFFGGVYYVESLLSQSQLHLTEKVALVCVLGAVCVVQLIPRLFGPQLAQLRLTSSDEMVTFPLEDAKANEDPAAGWVCAGCHERNPANFEICWNCERPRVAPAASNNRWRGP
jgi:hypothetical protein